MTGHGVARPASAAARGRAARPAHIEGVPVIPARFAPLLFGLILSGLMSLLVSGIATLRATGGGAGFPGLWAASWLTAWLVAFPVVLVVAPLARRLVGRLVRPG
jgi:hypothetical protein